MPSHYKSREQWLSGHLKEGDQWPSGHCHKNTGSNPLRRNRGSDKLPGNTCSRHPTECCTIRQTGSGSCDRPDRIPDIRPAGFRGRKLERENGVRGDVSQNSSKLEVPKGLCGNESGCGLLWGALSHSFVHFRGILIH